MLIKIIGIPYLNQKYDQQIGRSSEVPIDFVVMDTCPGGSEGGPTSEGGRVAQSTISRFACRILADRSDPKVAKIYAAGFDSSRNIFLGVSFHTPNYYRTI